MPWQWSIRLLVLVLGIAIAAPVQSADEVDEDEDESRPGLIAHYTAGDAMVQRIDADLSFAWGTESPDARLPEGPFQGRWEGQLLVRGEGMLQFHAWLQGRVTVRVRDTVVLEAVAETPQWVSGPQVPFRFGEWPITVEYERTTTAGQLQLAWSSNEYPLEPVPTHALYHTQPDAEWKREQRGQALFDGFRCQACHDRQNETVLLAAPALKTLRRGTNPEWLIAQLTRTEMAADSRMPAFGLSKSEAQDVLAALAAGEERVELPPATKQPDPKQIAAGKTLILSTGCLACHTWNETGQESPLAGPALDGVARRRSREWVLSWLKAPAALNPAHRMPVFALSDQERQQMAAALVPEPQTFPSWESAVPGGSASVQRGRVLLAAQGCANCHGLQDVARVTARSLRAAEVNWASGCTATDSVDRKGVPCFSGVEVGPLRTWIESWRRAAPQRGAYLTGEWLLTRKGCLLCHDREGQKGLSAIASKIARTDEALDGHAQLLVPPSLTAAGDRIRDSALAVSLKGEQPRRMDWLKVRMPRFQHTPEELMALSEYLIGHDRIPTPTPASPVYPIAQAGPPDVAQLLAGRELLGGKGFSCIACHRLKDYEPKNVARGTRGSNLFQIGQRVRPEYFFRWTRSPLRVTPGMEMPSYQKPHATLLGGDMEAQLAAIWEAINDPGLTVPSNPAVLEQFWTVAPGSPPRIVRDVMTIGAGKQKTSIPRAFAVGFDNGHAVLFDLDRLALRDWTVGDFARQRTEGKSWFWDLAGAPVTKGWDGESDFVVQREGSSEVLKLVRGEPAGLRLLDYQVDRTARAVELRYRVQWTAETPEMILTERWQALPASAAEPAGGWSRTITLQDAPAGWQLAVRQPKLVPALGTLTVRTAAPAEWETHPTAGAILLLRPGIPREFHYRTSITAQPAEYNAPPELIPEAQPVTDVPGYRGIRLPLPRSIMPTAITWTSKGDLAFTSLKGHVYLAVDTNSDGIPDKLTLVEEGLAAPYGIIADGPDLIVSHKPELLRLRDTDGDGRADIREIVATGWGYTDNYHDWTCGIVRDAHGDLLVALGSDYSQKGRLLEKARYRGDVLRISPSGQITPVAHGLRYATGLALTADGELLASDQQGEQNVFNEVNAIRPGRRYGVPALHDSDKDAPADPPAVALPHPWTRSVNGLATVPPQSQPFAGDILGCEYNNRLLIRCTTQLVDGERQGAAFSFSRPGPEHESNSLSGPLSLAFGPNGQLCVGEIRDSGWLGGLNVGALVIYTPEGPPPNGLKEILATAEGLELVFVGPIDRQAAANAGAYQVAGYTRVWGGAYATPDSGRHTAKVQSAEVNAAGDRVRLVIPELKPGHLYDVSVGEIGAVEQRALWPALGHVTLHRQPVARP